MATQQSTLGIVLYSIVASEQFVTDVPGTGSTLGCSVTLLGPFRNRKY